MKFQDIYHFFEEPPPVYLSKEVAVCYVLSILLERGDSYGTALIQCLETDHGLYRLSDTVLYSALKFLEDETVIEGYWQRVEGRGRPRRMYQVVAEQLELANHLASLWQKYLDQGTEGNSTAQRQSG
jgi:DNA-binding PadR family transcriptional regulator